MNCKTRKDAQRRAKTRKDAQRRANRKFWNFFWKLAKLTEEAAGPRVGYRKTHKIQTLKPYISLFKILLILFRIVCLKNQTQLNSKQTQLNMLLLHFLNRTKIQEKSALFGLRQLVSHRQFFFSPIRAPRQKHAFRIAPNKSVSTPCWKGAKSTLPLMGEKKNWRCVGVQTMGNYFKIRKRITIGRV